MVSFPSGDVCLDWRCVESAVRGSLGNLGTVFLSTHCTTAGRGARARAPSAGVRLTYSRPGALAWVHGEHVHTYLQLIARCGYGPAKTPGAL